ncbi:hypothetical protein OAO20_04215, partial [Candidatus Pelagibacter ubique]|nr:hypothetical protein [Candidatus Pelagibacter ubique]
MTKIFNLKKVILFISLFFTFYLWDIKNTITSLDGRLFILLYLPFFFKDFFKINKVAIYLTAALFTHYIISLIYLGNTISTKNIIQLVAIYYLIIFSFNIQDEFFKIMPNLIRIFIILFFILTVSNVGSYEFKEANIISSSCAWLLDPSLIKKGIIFGENSHFGMIAPASIIYFIFTLNQKNIKRDALIYTPMLMVILFVYLSTTLQAGIFFSIIALLFIFKKKHAFHYLLLLSLLVFTILSFVTKKECSTRVTRMNLANYTQLVLINYKFKLAEEKKIRLEQLKKEQLKILNQKVLSVEEKIRLEQLKKEQLKISKILMEAELWSAKENEVLKKINKTDSVYTAPNITVEVYQNAFLITFYSLLEKKIGYGIENYKIAFDEYTPNNIMKSDNVTRNDETRKRGNLTPEIRYLNRSDARSNLLKMITEFGFFSIIIFLFFLLFFFKASIKIENKVFLVSIVLTQLVSGAGYFNGGFLLSIC